VLADRFIWSDTGALSLISEKISDKDIQEYLFTIHGDTISIEEIKKWRLKRTEED